MAASDHLSPQQFPDRAYDPNSTTRLDPLWSAVVTVVSAVHHPKMFMGEYRRGR